jgi:hypothetical protein
MRYPVKGDVRPPQSQYDNESEGKQLLHYNVGGLRLEPPSS